MVKGSNVPGNMALLIFVSDSRNVFFYNKVIYNKILTFHGVLTHIKLQQFFHQVSLAEETCSRRMSLPIKCLNSSGEISPKPLNQVISGLGLNRSIAAIRSSSE